MVFVSELRFSFVQNVCQELRFDPLLVYTAFVFFSFGVNCDVLLAFSYVRLLALFRFLTASFVASASFLRLHRQSLSCNLIFYISLAFILPFLFLLSLFSTSIPFSSQCLCSPESPPPNPSSCSSVSSFAFAFPSLFFPPSLAV